MVGGILVQMHINAKIQNRYAEPGQSNDSPVLRGPAHVNPKPC